jgi:hypothetical protein
MTAPDGTVWPLRELCAVDCFDCSVVTYPAYESTSVSARSKLFPEGRPEWLEKRSIEQKMKSLAAIVEDAAQREQRRRAVEVAKLYL